MNILVLSPSKKLKKDKTEYSSEFVSELKSEANEVTVKEVFAPALESELKKSVKGESKPDLIIVPEKSDSESDFRSKFAFIISRGERKVQNIPNTKEKIDVKRSLKDLKNNVKYLTAKLKKQDVKREQREPKYVTYSRKKTHVFKIDLGGKTAYAFSYIGAKVAVIPEDINSETAQKLPELIFTAFSENEEAYPDGYSLTERTLKVTTFTERHFPRKGDSKDEVIRKSVMLAATLVFIVAGYLFVYNMFVIPAQQQALQSEIRTIFYENTYTSSGKANTKFKTPNWKKLKKINSDIKGWIKLNNTKIDYPILQSKSDNRYTQFYLNHNYLKQYTPRGFGAIFIDYRSKKGMKSKNIVLHGHHMEDGTMFGDMMKYGRYSGNLGFYKKSPTVKISTPSGGTNNYKIISVFKSNVSTYQGEYFDFYCSKFKNDAQFMNYVYNIRIRSLIDCPVNVNENDQLLTMVTCSYEFPRFRTVIVARKCRANESASVDTGSAKLNKKPVWPQCYYNRFRATRPTILTFKKAYKKGLIKWYDGSSKLSGSEQLPTSFKETTQPTAKPTTKPTQPKVTKPTEPPKKYYTIKITRYNKHGKKKVTKKKVVEGTVIKIIKSSNFKKNGYKYTFKKWKVKGVKGKKFLSRKLKKIRVRSNIRLAAKYKKKKIPVKKPAKPQPATENPTEAQNADDSEN
ncbi:MAG: class B sortase [Ruminococcus sp.]|nr:class B sortase [Ruminococcus sp.]